MRFLLFVDLVLYAKGRPKKAPCLSDVEMSFFIWVEWQAIKDVTNRKVIERRSFLFFLGRWGLAFTILIIVFLIVVIDDSGRIYDVIHRNWRLLFMMVAFLLFDRLRR